MMALREVVEQLLIVLTRFFLAVATALGIAQLQILICS